MNNRIKVQIGLFVFVFGIIAFQIIRYIYIDKLDYAAIFSFGVLTGLVFQYVYQSLVKIIESVENEHEQDN